ncbi:hypothetical protein HD553DRAFT_324435 [Filobasidium floriforme]|uniref:uncharacterized protein n=1 Tax=Filobasidium floriforme TaxID=5210 RepID=UPI001E8D36CE|nr:uncharacterized protein HD553DRAFT_324435 [Filobasidium floriforme]KAH8083523.1 hypothetical protein HD553DRAFT_324435 [Filobasidium floriforme]
MAITGGVSDGDQETCRQDDESAETGCETIKESRAEIRMGKHRETVVALHQERAGENHTGTSDEASLMRELATNANVVRFLADIRKATSPTASEMERTQLVTLLCDSGLGQLGGVLLASAKISPEVSSQLGLITEREKIQMSRISQAKQGYSALKKDIICLQQQWDDVECECNRDRETKAFLLKAASRFKGLLELVAPGFSAKLKKDADKN